MPMSHCRHELPVSHPSCIRQVSCRPVHPIPKVSSNSSGNLVKWGELNLAEINYSLHNRCTSKQQDEDILVITSRETKSVNNDAEIKSHKSPSPGPTPPKEIIDSYHGERSKTKRKDSLNPEINSGTSQLPPHLNRHGSLGGTPSSASLPPPPPPSSSTPNQQPPPPPPSFQKSESANPVFSRQTTLASISEEKKFG